MASLPKTRYAKSGDPHIAYQVTGSGSLDRSIRVPALVVHRSGGPVIRVEQARYLAQHIPGARLVEVPGEWRVFAVSHVL